MRHSSTNPNNLGLLSGDLAGFPHDRHVIDDVVTIELRAVAGVTYPLVDPSYKPDTEHPTRMPSSPVSPTSWTGDDR